MATTSILVNGVRHDWESVTVVGPQGTFIGITEISWEDKQEKELRYGKGGRPQGVGRTNYEAECSLTISSEEWQKLRAALGSAHYRAVFSLVITLDGESGVNVTTLKGVRVNAVKSSAKQGESEAGAREIDCIVDMIEEDGIANYD